jgi:Na+(H+)/acetate symporter ActP
MSAKKSKKGLSRENLIIVVVLLALLAFLLGMDPFSWMDMIQLKLLIGAVILVVIVLTLRSLNKKGR